MVVIVLNGHLAFAVWAQVVHLVAFPAQFSQNTQQPVTQIQWQRHKVIRLAASIAKHHALVTRSLLFWSCSLNALVDVWTLLVNRTQNTTTGGIKHVLTLGVADALNGVPSDLLHVNVGLAFHLSSQNHLTGGHQGFTSHFGLGVESEKMINQRIRNLIGHLIGVPFTDRFGSKEVWHIGF